jgi:hypothetical protein
VVTPISGFSSRFQGRKARLAEERRDALGTHQNLGALALGDDVARQLPADRGDLAIETAHAGLAGEALDELRRASSSNVTCAASRPFALSCLGTRNWLAMAFFSLSV